MAIVYEMLKYGDQKIIEKYDQKCDLLPVQIV